MQTKKLPIGYFIKQADDLLTKGINEIQSESRLTRTDWQILNSIAEKEQLNKAELITLMKPFADENSVNIILTKFKTGLLLSENGTKLSLTEKGIELHKTCFVKQKLFRVTAMLDITEQQYQQTISTLQKIIENLTKKDYASTIK
jgi:hypothetical protein